MLRSVWFPRRTPRAQFLPRGYRARIALFKTVRAAVDYISQDLERESIPVPQCTACRERFCKCWRCGTNLSPSARLSPRLAWGPIAQTALGQTPVFGTDDTSVQKSRVKRTHTKIERASRAIRT